MDFILPLMETESGHELPFHPYIFGIIGFACLMVLLAFTLAVGKGRPHS